MILSSLIALQFLYGTSTPLDIALEHVTNREVIQVMECESGLKQWNDNGALLTGQNGEIGIAQFKPLTWEWMNKKRGTDLDITNPMAQVNMIDWAFSQGLQNNWTCYDKN